jgi:hypothetical protein
VLCIKKIEFPHQASRIQELLHKPQGRRCRLEIVRVH